MKKKTNISPELSFHPFIAVSSKQLCLSPFSFVHRTENRKSGWQQASALTTTAICRRLRLNAGLLSLSSAGPRAVRAAGQSAAPRLALGWRLVFTSVGGRKWFRSPCWDAKKPSKERRKGKETFHFKFPSHPEQKPFICRMVWSKTVACQAWCKGTNSFWSAQVSMQFVPDLRSRET